MSNNEGPEFESEVLNIARQLWPSPSFSGGPAMVDGLERDAVFITEDIIHCVESTIERTKSKAVDDGKKLQGLIKKYEADYPEKAVKGWFITKHEPTADQLEAIKLLKMKTQIISISFHGFQAKIIDARGYLSTRDNYFFGSISHPDGISNANDVMYISIDSIDENSGDSWNSDKISLEIKNGKRFCLFGDYGSGKSMTLRDIYKKLKERYIKNFDVRFPVYINLRDHHDQANTEEVLDRHAFKLGFSPRSHLVRAWRAGYVYLILDGLDEIIAPGVQNYWRDFQRIRRDALQIIRDFIKETPNKVGLIMAGRRHLFNSVNERTSSLGIDKNFIIVNISDFKDKQIKELLFNSRATKKWIPEWMPKRPLLLGYLLVRQLLPDVEDMNNNGDKIDEADGWDYLIGEICKREASNKPASINPNDLRVIMERLATKARHKNDGLGPISINDLVGAFEQVCGYEPSGGNYNLLVKLPGLGLYDKIDGQELRQFVDERFVETCRVGDVFRIISDDDQKSKDLICNAIIPIGDLGINILANKCGNQKLNKQILSALANSERSSGFDALKYDFLCLCRELGININFDISISGLVIDGISFDFEGDSQIDLSNVHFNNCYFTPSGLSPSRYTHLDFR